jgi:imidazole glycerol-phosphate synthase subunit HisH
MSGQSQATSRGAPTVAIVDYGAGNVSSVRKAFAYLGAKIVVTSRPEVVAKADKIVLPGVGHFSALGTLENAGLREACLGSIRAGQSFLGICLGMQWLFEGSDEAPGLKGAGMLRGRCAHFPREVKSPHVGWNSIEISNGSRLLRGIRSGAFVYYTHSFYAPVVESTAASTEYGNRFSAVVERENFFGIQFHPEKSSAAGLQILRNFCEAD